MPTEAEFAWAKQTHFERCAGLQRPRRAKALLAPALTPDDTFALGALGWSRVGL
ncbi:MAG: hypothetical protein KatS3mg052_2283 [Candidatus Roseilinea sp.]|nr:MAG: hypothetical protein KatS3mg052_2283 [Candidatus Roseilinea sp.]